MMCFSKKIFFAGLATAFGFVASLVAQVAVGTPGTLATPVPENEIYSYEFNPGRIIDDHIFTDASTMSIDDIQAFLEQNIDGGTCDRYRENPYGDTNAGPYTCLFEFQQNRETGTHNYGLFDDEGAPSDIEGGVTAAEIIHEAALQYQINPQVLLVLLQKEQSLITDNWPWLGQFDRATGYHCPDNAPCSNAYSGFYKQIQGAAWQFRQYLDNIDTYWYIIGDNYILYNPNTSCGSKLVHIENHATIALYLYTPYVPNEAALNNLFGYGDSCSAYGNRNFWSYFLRWFGPTTDEDHDYGLGDRPDDEPKTWAFESSFSAVYSDPGFSVSIDPSVTALKANEIVYVYLEFENTGTALWENQDDEQMVYLATPESRNPDLGCHADWQNNCRQVTLAQQNRINPHGHASFEFPLLLPNADGEITEEFRLENPEQDLEGDPVQISFHLYGAEIGTIAPAPTTPPEEPEEEETPAPTTTPVVVLPDNWHELSVIEKILLNPWGCHDTTQIRADNGQCLSGGYTIPGQPTPAPTTPPEEPEEEETPAPTTTPVVVLPDNWHELSVIEKILLNPWGCHDTTQIRADNGQCLSGGYTIPGQPTPAPTTPPEEPEEEETPAPTTTPVVVLPDNWHELSVIEKILLNPWGCHDTTQIRADNGQCLSGGYTIPEN